MSNPLGDPAGRRMAKQRAARLSEAGMLLRSLEVLLQRAGADTSQCLILAETLEREERRQLQIADGRIESRKRFKHKSGHPLRADHVANGLFIDESGRSDQGSTAKQPVFALGAVALTVDAAASYHQRADELKMKFWGHTDITFHEPQMRRHETRFWFDGDVKRQLAFDEALDELVAGTEFTVFGAIIRKAAFHSEFVAAGLDPYLPTDVYSVAILMLLERYVDYLLADGIPLMGRVTFESQGPLEDAIHQLEFARLLIDGTQWVPQSAFQQAIETGAKFVPKQGTHPTELADMVSRDLYEWVSSGLTAVPTRWNLINERIYVRGDGKHGKFGVKIFPDSDIRSQVEAHRERVISARAN